MAYFNTDFYILILFILTNIATGLISSRSQDTIHGYLLANRKFTTSTLAFTYIILEIGETLSRQEFDLHKFNTSYIYPQVAGIISFCIVRGVFISPKILKFRSCLTLGDIIAKLYGDNVRIFIGFICTIYSCMAMILQISCMHRIGKNLLIPHNDTAIILAVAGLIIYLTYGGIRAGISTGVLQFSTVTCAVIASTFIVNRFNYTNSFTEYLSMDEFALLNILQDKHFISTFLLLGVFSIDFAEPFKVQRILMAQNTTQLRYTFFYLGFIEAIIAVTILGLALTIPNIYPDVSFKDGILHLYNDLFPPYCKPIFSIAFLAILLASCSSYLHSAAASFSYDFMSPLMKRLRIKEISEIHWAKAATVGFGIITVLFSIFAGHLMTLKYLFAILCIFIVSPLLLGIAGFATTSRTYSVSCIWSVAAFLMCKLLARKSQELHLLITVASGTIGFLLEHLYRYGNFKIISSDHENHRHRQRNRLINFLKDLFQIQNEDSSGKITQEKKHQYKLFGTLYIIHLLWQHHIPVGQERDFLILKLVAAALCLVLIFEPDLPDKLRRHTRTLWYVATTYCLPFMTTIIVIVSNNLLECVISVSIATTVMVLLFGTNIRAMLSIFGVSAGIVFYKYSISESFSLPKVDLTTVALLLYQIFFINIVAIFFKNKKKIFVLDPTLKETVDTQLREYTESEFAAIRAAQTEVVKTIDGANGGILERVQKLKEYLRNKDVQQLKSSISSIEEYIKAILNEVNVCFSLHVTKISLEELIIGIENLARVILNRQVSVVMKATAKDVEIDKILVYKIVIYILFDVNSKVENKSIDKCSPIFIHISDAEIDYLSVSNKSYSNTVDAVKIIFSTFENLTLFNMEDNKHIKELEDPEIIIEGYKINKKPKKPILLVNAKFSTLVNSQYGMVETFDAQEGASYTFIFPEIIWDIHPKNSESSPPGAYFGYYPTANELERKFKIELPILAPLVTIERVNQAFSLIKKHHINNRRKSGEPCYMHPKEVTRIVLNMMNYNSAEVSKILQENQDTVVISALLHDLLDSKTVSPAEITEIFGSQVCDVVAKISEMSIKNNTSPSTSIYNLNILAVTAPIPACIKIADRLHNIQTIDGHTTEIKRKAVAQETLNFFVTPALDLGFDQIARDLESASKWVLKHGRLGDFEFEIKNWGD